MPAERSKALGFAGVFVAIATAATVAMTTGCGHPKTYFGATDDYSAYRATRLGKTLDDRLAASESYLKRFPNGDYAPEVSRYFDEAEPVFYAAKRGSVSGLEAYLRALPRGARSESALDELRALRDRKEAEADMRGVTALGARITALGAQRTRVRTELDLWIRRFLEPGVWDTPIRDSSADLIVAWSLGLPYPVCSVPEDYSRDQARRCAKILELPYTVTADGNPEEHQATIEIAMIQDAIGRPVQVTIGGPDLFIRVEETFSARAISHDDAAQREAATARVLDMVARSVEERVAPGPDCKRPPAGATILHYACKGVRVTVRATRNGTDDDLITLGRL